MLTKRIVPCYKGGRILVKFCSDGLICILKAHICHCSTICTSSFLCIISSYFSILFWFYLFLKDNLIYTSFYNEIKKNILKISKLFLNELFIHVIIVEITLITND